MVIGERKTVTESAGGGWVYERVTRRVINGTPYRFAYRIDHHRFAHLVVGNELLGVQAHKYELGHVAQEDMPGMVDFSLRLGKLMGF